MKPHAVYSYGVVSSSTLYRVRGAFPAAEGYAEIEDVHYMTGGEATNSSIVLSRLGVPVKLDGNWLGADKNGERTKALLSDHQIDTTRLALREGVNGVQEVVFAAENTRTVFGTYGHLLEEAAWNMPVGRDVTEARVTVDCKFNDPLLRQVSAVVISESYIRENYADRDAEEVFRHYQAATGGLTIFTFGDATGWYARPGETARYFQPYAIDPVDTSGGGDAFRAGIVYGFLQGWDDVEMIDFASAIAAMVCTRFPGVMNAPTVDAVADFMSTTARTGPGDVSG